MTAPNIVSVTNITGKTDVQAVTTNVTAITTCPLNKLYKVNSVIVANISTTTAYDITVDFYRSSQAFNIASTITIPAKATLVVVSKDMGIYLEETDAIRLTASANSVLQAICSYEIIS